jgi:hypothetical protein
MTKTSAAHVVLSAVAMACSQAHALGFGRVNPDVALGQPLAFIVPVHVEPTERFGADCVHARVVVGDTPVLPNQVRIGVTPGAAEGDWLVRIGTTFAIEEPVVDITLDAGCGQPFTRRFTAFASPANPALATMPGEAGASPAGVAAAHGTGAGAIASATPAASAGAARHKGTRTNAAGAGATAVASARPPAPAAAARAAGGQGARLVLDAGVASPHLKMDIDDPVIPPAGAASAAAAAALSDEIGASTQSLQGLQASIALMRRETNENRQRTAALEAQLAQSREAGAWTPWLLGLLGLSLVAVAALAWRLRRLAGMHAHSRWFTDSQLAPPAPAPRASTPAPAAPSLWAPEPAPHEAERPLPTIEAGIGAQGSALPAVEARAPAPAPVPVPRAPVAHEPVASASMPLEPRVVTELSVEELLDLEQQADFFIALGQEDAAVDLLMAHLRSAGGQSPLPYTKLLEIFRRQGDRAAYERTRARFNRRFNAYAPDWDTGPGAGRVLEDYPHAVEQIQGAWIAPIDAMAILEAMLFRRDESSELFDLPAYRDVLVLYAIARDLWQQGEGAGGARPVDVLLPMAGAAGLHPAFEPTVRASGFGSSFAELPEAAALPALDTADTGAPSAWGDLHATLQLETQMFDPTRPGLPAREEGPANEAASSEQDRRRR